MAIVISTVPSRPIRNYPDKKLIKFYRKKLLHLQNDCRMRYKVAREEYRERLVERSAMREADKHTLYLEKDTLLREIHYSELLKLAEIEDIRQQEENAKYYERDKIYYQQKLELNERIVARELYEKNFRDKNVLDKIILDKNNLALRIINCNRELMVKEDLNSRDINNIFKYKEVMRILF